MLCFRASERSASAFVLSAHDSSGCGGGFLFVLFFVGGVVWFLFLFFFCLKPGACDRQGADGRTKAAMNHRNFYGVFKKLKHLESSS